MGRQKKRKWYENSYVSITGKGTHYELYQRKWIVGTVFLLAFSPGFYIALFKPEVANVSPAILRLIMGAIFFVGVWLIAHYRKAVFDKGSGEFSYQFGLFIPITNIRGKLSDIECIKIGTMVTHDYHDTSGGHGGSTTVGRKRRSHRHDTLSFIYQGKAYKLAESGAAASRSKAKKLAELIGCPFDS